MFLTKTVISPIIVFAALLTPPSYASSCPQALAIDDPGFCQSFSQVAQCHCQSSGLPARMCSNVQLVYQRMISTFGSVERACKYQKDTSYDICMQDWQCYLNGGSRADGALCSQTGQACI
jgi:hypothetical protein